MPRNIADADLKVTFALPNAANTVNSNAIDLGSTTPYPVTENILVRLSGSLATAANSKNINYVFQHSAEAAANFTNIVALAVKVVAGNATNAPAFTRNVALPPDTKRYLRVSATGEANGGNSADGTGTLQILT